MIRVSLKPKNWLKKHKKNTNSLSLRKLVCMRVTLELIKDNSTIELCKNVATLASG